MAAYEHAILYKSIEANWVFKQATVQILEGCEGFELIQLLNYLGQDHWQFAGQLNTNEYVLKREL